MLTPTGAAQRECSRPPERVPPGINRTDIETRWPAQCRWAPTTTKFVASLTHSPHAERDGERARLGRSMAVGAPQSQDYKRRGSASAAASDGRRRRTDRRGATCTLVLPG